MIKVYQINLTDEEIDLINTQGYGATPRTQAFADRTFISTFKAENFQHYNHVADVLTDDMEEAFSLMNLWDNEAKVEMYDLCSSMSVGDILELEDGSLHRCASFGFERINVQ